MLSTTNLRIAQLILAAGGSKRMGSPKQLLSFRGTSLIEYAISESIKTNVTQTFVVLGANYDLIQQKIASYPVSILKNLSWEVGMGSSIRFGMEHIKKEKKYDAVLISLIDQPLLGSSHYDQLINELIKNKNNIVATDLGKRVGVPAIFTNDYFDELSELDADYGARYVIEKNNDKVKKIQVYDKGKDIDTPKEYKDLIAGR